LTVFDEWYTVPIAKNTQNHILVYQTSQVYQDCTKSVSTVFQSSKQPKDSQNSKNDHWCTNRHLSTKTVPTCTNNVPIVKNSQKTVKIAKITIVYQSSQLYQDCTNSVPTVYQSSKTVQNSQKQSKDSQNSKKRTIGVPIVTCLPRLYQQCNNSLPIVNKNLAIANRSRISCAHNTSRAFIGLNIRPTP